MRRHFARRDPVMAALMRAAGPYRLEVEASRSPFESLARAITHQQLNGIVANRILQRFIARAGKGHIELRTFTAPAFGASSAARPLQGIGFDGH